MGVLDTLFDGIEGLIKPIEWLFEEKYLLIAAGLIIIAVLYIIFFM